MDHLVVVVALTGIVVIVASLLSSLLERSAVPIVAVFLALGAMLGPWGLRLVDIRLDSPELQVLATLGLALVLFSDAVTLDIKELRPRRALLLILLGPGTLIPAAAITITAKLLLGVPLAAAAILGAALASTDPVMLRTALRPRALPDTTRLALRMETGMNDIVLLPIVVIAMILLGRSGGATTPTGHHDLTTSVVGLFLLGPVLGALVGWAGISALGWVRRRVGVRRDYESIYALGLAFCAFAAAEGVGGSGFVAAFAAGIMIDAQDTELCDCFLEYGEATAEMFLLLTFVALGTTLIWTGFEAVNLRTIAFATVALGVRSAVLYPILGGLGLAARDRRLIALMGPRGLSSLLLVLLPVFAGVAGATELFTVTCLVVLLSLVLHGGGISIYLRRHSAARVAEPAPAIAVPSTALQSEEVPERITLDEMSALRARGEPVVVADGRTDSAYYSAAERAVGSVRIDPDFAVQDAVARQLPRDATIAVYCA